MDLVLWDSVNIYMLLLQTRPVLFPGHPDKPHLALQILRRKASSKARDVVPSPEPLPPDALLHVCISIGFGSCINVAHRMGWNDGF